MTPKAASLYDDLVELSPSKVEAMHTGALD